ncbi:MAG: alpha/beta fold hydrolase [Christensenella sp.]
MKKCKWLTIILAALFCFSGCAMNVKFDEQALKDKSNAYMQNLIAGDTTTVAAGVAPSSAKELNNNTLAQAWESLAPQLGTFEKVISTDFSSSGELAKVDVSCDFTNRGLRATFTYNAQQEIAALWLSFIPKTAQPQNTDTYTETAVQIGSEQPVEGLLTLPKNTTSAPAVLMVAGSGAQDMDETIGAAGNKPFADIAHALAAQGIATLRYNKRTSQYPNAPKDPLALTVEYEVLNDAAAGAELLQNTDGIDKNRIFVLGHSFGGMLAPKIAEQNALAGLISMAGSPRRLEDIMLEQNYAAIDAATDATAEQKENARKQAAALTDQPKNAKQGDKTMMLGAPANYWYTLNLVDTHAIARSLDVPMLFLQGEKDFQVSPALDFNAWKELLLDKSNAEFILYPDLNHLFMPAGASNTVADYDTAAAVDAQVTADISNWINSQK